MRTCLAWIAAALLLTACSALGLYTEEALTEAIIESGGDPARTDRAVARAAEVTDSWWWQIIASVLGGSGLAVGYQRFRPSRAKHDVDDMRHELEDLRRLVGVLREREVARSLVKEEAQP